MFKTFVLIIMVFINGSQVSVTEHQFSSYRTCDEARQKAIDLPFMFSREVKAFCVEK